MSTLTYIILPFNKQRGTTSQRSANDALHRQEDDLTPQGLDLQFEETGKDANMVSLS